MILKRKAVPKEVVPPGSMMHAPEMGWMEAGFVVDWFKVVAVSPESIINGISRCCISMLWIAARAIFCGKSCKKQRLAREMQLQSVCQGPVVLSVCLLGSFCVSRFAMKFCLRLIPHVVFSIVPRVCVIASPP